MSFLPQYSEFSIQNYYVGQRVSGFPEDYEGVEWITTSSVRGPKTKVKHLLKAPVTVEKVLSQSFSKLHYYDLMFIVEKVPLFYSHYQ